MNNLGNAKTFGGIGALLSLFGWFIPSAGIIVSIAGLVLIFLAVKSISESTKDHDIFKNYLMYFILSIIAVVAIFGIILIGFGASGGFTWITEIQSAQITDIESFMQYFGPLVGACALALIIGWILSIIGALYLRKSYNSIAEHTQVDMFRTMGTVYFIGAITTIILIGFIILFIAKIIEIIAFFSLPNDLPGTKKEKSERRCPNCDRTIPEDASICPYCGKNFKE